MKREPTITKTPGGSAPKRTVSRPFDLAAAQNLQPGFLELLSKIELQVVVINFQAARGSVIWKHIQPELELGRELEAIQAGHHDSSFYLPWVLWHFFHVRDLGRAMTQLKLGLAARGLLEISTLIHVETAEEWRVWYPGTAELILPNADTEA